MPSRVNKLMVDQTAALYEQADSLVAMAFTKIGAEEAGALRRKLRDEDASIRVIKNRIARLAFKALGREEFARLIDGPVAIVTAADPVAASKAAVDIAKKRGLDLKGGWAEGRVITEAEVRSLAALPSRNELLASVAWVAAAPLRALVGMVAAPAASLARVVNAWNDTRSSNNE